jgi:hypothetical protein
VFTNRIIRKSAIIDARINIKSIFPIISDGVVSNREVFRIRATNSPRIVANRIIDNGGIITIIQIDTKLAVIIYLIVYIAIIIAKGVIIIGIYTIFFVIRYCIIPK